MMPAAIKFNRMNYVEIRELVMIEIERLQTQSAVATKCNVSSATINLIVNENWNGVKDGMWRKVAAALGWRPVRWQVVETNDIRILHQTFADAKEWGWWSMVSSAAGSQKTTAAETYAYKYAGNNVYYLECERWHKSKFVAKLAQALGISLTYKDLPDDVIDKVVQFFARMADKKPILILDQFDKLHDNAISTLLPLFNGCDGKMACVIMGVGHLKKIFQANVNRQNMFWDELESRFARTYITTYGVTYKEVSMIAKANGLHDQEAIKKVWMNCNPDQIMIGGNAFKVVKDMRLLKRRIQVEILRTNMHEQLEEVALN